MIKHVIHLSVHSFKHKRESERATSIVTRRVAAPKDGVVVVTTVSWRHRATNSGKTAHAQIRIL